MLQWLSQLVFWHWLALALVLGIMDVILGANFFFVWCGAAAVLVGGILFLIPTMAWEYQFLIFGIGVLGSFLLWRRYIKAQNKQFSSSTLNRRAAQYLGRVFTLDTPIENGRGKVRVDDSYWLVEGPDMPAGERVKVIGTDGVVLKIEKN